MRNQRVTQVAISKHQSIWVLMNVSIGERSGFSCVVSAAATSVSFCVWVTAGGDTMINVVLAAGLGG